MDYAANSNEPFSDVQLEELVDSMEFAIKNNLCSPGNMFLFAAELRPCVDCGVHYAVWTQMDGMASCAAEVDNHTMHAFASQSNQQGFPINFINSNGEVQQ